jgi:muconolactone delta-isomerase
MEYLVSMTTLVPEGTPEEAVTDIRAREAARSRELVAQGHLLRLWTRPDTSPLSPHPSDPAINRPPATTSPAS